MRILAGLIIAMGLMAATPQTSDDYSARYGKPDAERFVVRPDLVLMVEYGADGGACKMRIEPRYNFVHMGLADLNEPAVPMGGVTQVLDEVVPPDARGKQLTPGKLFENVAGVVRRAEFENVTIIPEFGGVIPQSQITSVAVLFKRPECNRLPKYYDPDWLKPK